MDAGDDQSATTRAPQAAAKADPRIVVRTATPTQTAATAALRDQTHLILPTQASHRMEVTIATTTITATTTTTAITTTTKVAAGLRGLTRVMVDLILMIRHLVEESVILSGHSLLMNAHEDRRQIAAHVAAPTGAIINHVLREYVCTSNSTCTGIENTINSLMIYEKLTLYIKTALHV